jgi:hypothetical protein
MKAIDFRNATYEWLRGSLEAENADHAPQRALFDRHHDHKDALAATKPLDVHERS